MLTTSRPTPSSFGVDELRAAWHALTAGQFATTLATDAEPTCAPGADAWRPGPAESVIVVRGCLGSASATTVSLAIATASVESSRAVECCPASASGLVSAASAELGDDGAWRRGRRGGVLLEHRIDSRTTTPTPAPTGSFLTVIDAGTTAPGWVAEVPASGLVLVTRATVPGLRRLEAALDACLDDALVVAVLGPPLKRWPKSLTRAIGVQTRDLADGGRLVDVPLDRTLAISGLTPEPLPAPVLAAGGRILTLFGKESR